MFKTAILSAAFAALLVAAAPSAQAQEPIVIKFSHVVAVNTPKGQAAIKFKELAEAATKGKVKIEVYPNSQLYKDKEELEALQLGSVQMLAPSLAKFGPLGVKEFEAFDLPYIFPDKASLHKITEGPVGAKLMAKLEPKGFKGLAFWDNGFKIMSANKPLIHPDDFKGLKFRIQSSKVIDAQMRALGAIPQVMAFSEVYQALQTGVVDGTENPPSNMYTQKMHEVQKHVTVSNHGYLGYAVIVNKKFWDGLPPDIRASLAKAMAEATTFEKAIAQRAHLRVEHLGRLDAHLQAAEIGRHQQRLVGRHDLEAVIPECQAGNALGVELLQHALADRAFGHAVQRLLAGEQIRQVEHLEFLYAQRAELGQRRRQHLDRAQLQRFELFLVLVQLAVRIDFDLDAPAGGLFGQHLEALGRLALGRVGGHHVAELDDDGGLGPGIETDGCGQGHDERFDVHVVSYRVEFLLLLAASLPLPILRRYCGYPQ